ncbi:MAG: carboxypeptidase-like regulatory domain-containing protein [Gemmatimonadaceae bacterium]
MRAPSAVLGGLIAALVVCPAAHGQVVRGVVRDSASGAPAAGVLVALIDAASGARRTALTDEAGQFTVAAAGAGTFALETKRIGVRPALTPRFSLGAGETREFGLSVAAVVPRLAAVRVTGKSYCAERLKEGAETAALWEEIRAALTATLITRERRTFPVTISRFRRTFEPTRLQVRHEERSEQSGLASNPFLSVPITALSSNGYITSDGSGTL